MSSKLKNNILLILGLIVLVSLLYRIFVWEPAELDDKANREITKLELERDEALKIADSLHQLNQKLKVTNDSLYVVWEEKYSKFDRHIDSLKKKYNEQRTINELSTTDERVRILSEWLNRD